MTQPTPDLGPLSGQAQDTTQQPKQAVQDVAGRAQETVKTQMRGQGEDLAARAIDQAADRAEQLSQYLKSSSADRILHDLEDFGRKQPWAVILGGLVAGMAASRFLKASSRRRYQAAQQNTRPRFESSAVGTYQDGWRG